MSACPVVELDSRESLLDERRPPGLVSISAAHLFFSVAWERCGTERRRALNVRYIIVLPCFIRSDGVFPSFVFGEGPVRKQPRIPLNLIEVRLM